MHRDQKVGLALGILLIGVVGALFFRNETSPHTDAPQLDDPGKLDDAIKEDRRVQLYDEPAVKLKGIEFDDPAEATFTKGTSLFDESIGDRLRTTGDSRERTSDGPTSPPPPIEASPVGVPDGLPDVPVHNKTWNLPDGEPRQPRDANAQTARTHEVQKGDTLTELASRYLGSSQKFLEIYRANRSLLRDPNDLRVGMKLRIPARQRTTTPPPVPATTVSRKKTSSDTGGSSTDDAGTKDAGAKTENRETPTGESAAPRRFVPVRKSPFLRPPRRSTSAVDKKRPQSLSQVPPQDLPSSDR